MSTFLEPVGPHAPKVYWRRRLVVGGVVLVLLLVLLRACTGGDDAADPQADRSPAPAATTTDSPTDGADGDADGKAGDGTTKPASTRTSGAPGRCADGDVEVTARPVEDSFGTGSTVGIRFVVATKDGTTCRRDVGAAANEVKVLGSGGELVWSSDHCSPSEQEDVRTLGPDEPYSVLVEWDGSVTPSDCPADRLPAPAGEYEAVGRNADVTGPAASFTLG